MSDILEAAARALREVGMYGREAESYARTILAAVTPLIEAAALERLDDNYYSILARQVAAIEEDTLERAAKVAEEFPDGGAPWLTEPPFATKHIAAAIRSLKEQP